jgi:flagellar protein FlaJ
MKLRFRRTKPPRRKARAAKPVKEAREKQVKKKRRSPLARAGVYFKLSAIFPLRVVEAYRKILTYAGSGADPREYLGSRLFSSVIIFIIAFFVLPVFVALEPLYHLTASLFIFVVLMLWSYVGPMLAADKKALEIEKVLPDALQLVSSNIRAGMTIDKALWLCAKPEFGPLEKELRKMASETLGGKALAKSLEDSAKRVKSDLMDRAMLLLVQGIALGGEVAHLLVEIASDIRTNQALRKEINAATSMYTVFIIFASVLAAPALFAVSTFYVQSTTALWGGKMTESASEMEQLGGVQMFKMTGGGITAEEVRLFAIACIVVTTSFGGITIGMIKYGRAKRGIKYVPPFVLGALGIYFVAYTIILSMFGMILT